MDSKEIQKLVKEQKDIFKSLRQDIERLAELHQNSLDHINSLQGLMYEVDISSQILEEIVEINKKQIELNEKYEN
jgi:hypothetical protein